MILGGILAVGIISFLLLILAIMGEAKQEKLALAQAGSQTKSVTKESTTLAPVRQAPAVEKIQDRDSRMPVYRGDTGLQLANGQVAELASELRALHTQAQEIEQRLAILVDVIDRIERPKHARVVIAEERNSEPGRTAQ